MTSIEINTEISIIRNQWEDDGPIFKIPFQWDHDSNWPTLLREMSNAMQLHLVFRDGLWFVSSFIDNSNPIYSWATDGSTADPGIAVCIAWLRWKHETGEVKDERGLRYWSSESRSSSGSAGIKGQWPPPLPEGKREVQSKFRNYTLGVMAASLYAARSDAGWVSALEEAKTILNAIETE